MNRREFIKLGGYTLLSATWLTASGRLPPQVYTDGKSLIDDDLDQKIIDTAHYRELFQLPSLPDELKEEQNAAPRDLEKFTTTFENNLPSFMSSYGERVKQLSSIIFGPLSEGIVRSVTMNPSLTSYASFEQETRELTLSRNIHTGHPIDNGFLDIFMHEVAGHGSDLRNTKGLFSAPDRIRGAHGKSRALSQALLVEGQFLHHPGDQMLPKIQLGLAMSIGQKYVDKSIQDYIKSGMDNLLNALDQKAKEKGIKKEDLRFTRRTCVELGSELFYNVLTKRIILTGELYDSYVNTVEGALDEIYAEMVRYSILYPEKIFYNREIIEGVTEELSTLYRKPIDLVELREKIIEVPDEILRKFNEENDFLKNQEKLNAIMTPEQKEQMKQETKRLEQMDIDFEKLTTEATLPESFYEFSQEIIDTMQRYANALTKVYTMHPEIKTALTNDLLFDPNLHVWDTMEIASAANPNRIWNCINDPHYEFEVEGMDVIHYNIEWLEWFIQSDAFGTKP
jgi:hypothetical protein